MYEIIESIEDDDTETLKEELGDLTLHIIFQAELAREKNQFDIVDSLKHVSDKLISRHPNIFDSQSNSNIPWELSKQKEKKRNSILDGVPKDLPALLKARRIQEKAANVGFNWEKIEPVVEKLDEEIDELKQALALNNNEQIIDEMGDVLFSVVNLSRFLKINPEESLRKSINKFEKRFKFIEEELKKENKSFSDCNLEELDKIWNLSKNNNI